MAKCPFCDEIIGIEAIKCRHCGELLVSEPNMEGGEPVQVIAHDFENSIKTVFNNPELTINYLPFFGWKLIDRKLTRLHEENHWSGINDDLTPFEVNTVKYELYIKRRKSKVPKELLEIEKIFFENLLWLNAKEFKTSYGVELFLFCTLSIFFLFIYIFIHDNQLTLCTVAMFIYLSILIICSKNRQKQEEEYEKYRTKIAPKKHTGFVKLLKKFYKSDVLDIGY